VRLKHEFEACTQCSDRTPRPHRTSSQCRRIRPGGLGASLIRSLVRVGPRRFGGASAAVAKAPAAGFPTLAGEGAEPDNGNKVRNPDQRLAADLLSAKRAATAANLCSDVPNTCQSLNGRTIDQARTSRSEGLARVGLAPPSGGGAQVRSPRRGTTPGGVNRIHLTSQAGTCADS